MTLVRIASRRRASIHLLPFVCLLSGSQCLMAEATVEPSQEQSDAGTSGRGAQGEMISGAAKAGAGGSKSASGGAGAGGGGGNAGVVGGGGMGGSSGKGGAGGVVARGGSGGRAGSAGAPIAGAKPVAPTQAGAGGAGTNAPAPPLVSTAWSAPELLEERSTNINAVGSANNLKGELAVTWLQEEPQGYLWMRRYAAGEWSDEVTVAGGARPPVTYPQWMAMDAKGNVHVLQAKRDSQTTNVVSMSAYHWDREANELRATTPELFPSERESGFPYALTIDDESGHASVLVASVATSNATSLGIYHVQREGEAWGEPQMAATLDVAANYRLVGSSNQTRGAILIAVPNPDEAGTRFESVVLHEGATKQLMPLTTSMDAGTPIITLDDAGNALMIVFLGTHCYAARYKQGSDAWGELEQLSTTSPRWIQALQPRRGKPVVLWFTSNVSVVTSTSMVYGGTLYARFLQDDNTWSAEEVVSSAFSTDANDRLVDGAFNAAGDLTLFWSQAENAAGVGAQQKSIRSRRHRAGQGWLDPTLVFGYTGKIGVVGIAAQGDTTTLVWTQLNASNNFDLLWTHSLPEKAQP